MIYAKKRYNFLFDDMTGVMDAIRIDLLLWRVI